jgi:two-component system repressor protein LuxO
MDSTTKNILVIDDDLDFQRLIKWYLEQGDFSVEFASSHDQASERIRGKEPDAILLDWQLGEDDGTELIALLKRHFQCAPIIFSTAHSTPEVAARSIKLGAFDFLTKPVDQEHLLLTVTRAVEHGELLQRLSESRYSAHLSEFEGLTGASPQMQSIYAAIRNVASTDVTVMICGESGTGKELVANAIHRLSTRENNNFTPMNMASIPADLVESSLFGHVKGAFTGADRDKKGAVAEANHGTLFMDEITEMPSELQAKLLRYLQEHKYRPVGGDKDLEAEARVISATNRDPSGAVQDGNLREDLFYRLNVVPITIPPLREREGDVALLASKFLQAFSAEYEKGFESFQPASLELLERYAWPGNVRELENLMRRIIVMNDGNQVTPEMIPEEICQVHDGARHQAFTESDDIEPGSQVAEPSTAQFSGSEIVPMSELEKRAIEHALRCCGSAYEAARQLGISKATIYRKIKLYDIAHND